MFVIVISSPFYFDLYKLPLMRGFRLSFILLLCLSFSALPAQVDLVGKVIEPKNSIVTIIVPPTSLGGETRKLSKRLSDGNTFRFSIQTNTATPAVIAHAGIRIPVFMLPDQSFTLEFTAGKGKATGIRFGGPSGDDNTLLHRYLQFLETETPRLDSSQLARSTAKEYRTLMDRNQAAREGFLTTYIQSAKVEIAPQLLQWLRNDIAYTYGTQLLRYPSVFEDFHQGAKTRTPPASYYSFLSSIRINNPEAILLDSYQRFLESFFIYKMERPMRWEMRTGGRGQYAQLNRYFLGLQLFYMQYLVFERTLDWLIDADYMAEEFQSFMASKAPDLLKQKLRRLRENPPRVYSMNSFSIKGSPLLSEVFQFQNGDRAKAAFFKGRPSLLYFYDRRLARGDFIIRYLKRLQGKVEGHPDMTICLVDVNTNFNAWQKVYARNGYKNDPITHLSMNYFDELFDQRLNQGRYPNLLVADANGIIIETLDWKPPVKQMVEIIKRIL